MKLIILIVVSIVVFTANCHKPPDGSDLSRVGRKQKENKARGGSKCKSGIVCSLLGGSCVINSSYCSGREVPSVCDGAKCKCCIPVKLEVKVHDLETEVLSMAVNLTMANANLNNKLDSVIKHQGTIEAKFDNISSGLNSELISLNKKMNTSESNLNVELQSLKTNIKSDNSKLNTELQSLKNIMSTGDANINTRIQAIKSSLDNGISNVNSKLDNQGCSHGTFLFRPSNQCFRLLTDKGRNYDAAKAACRALGLHLGQPYDPISLRQYLRSKHGRVSHTWIGARGTGSYITWERTRVNIHNTDNPYWANGRPGSWLSSTHCLILLTNHHYWKSEPNQPYYNQVCTHPYTFTLCEHVRG